MREDTVQTMTTRPEMALARSAQVITTPIASVAASQLVAGLVGRMKRDAESREMNDTMPAQDDAETEMMEQGVDDWVLAENHTAENNGKVNSMEQQRRDLNDAIQAMTDSLEVLAALHNEMTTLEAEAWHGATCSLREQVGRLRQQRALRPRFVCNLGVSLLSGEVNQEGLEKVRCVLQALVEDKRLFPQVGAKVPLNYSMLERLAQESRAQPAGREILSDNMCGGCRKHPILG